MLPHFQLITAEIEKFGSDDLRRILTRKLHRKCLSYRVMGEKSDTQNSHHCKEMFCLVGWNDARSCNLFHCSKSLGLVFHSFWVQICLWDKGPYWPSAPSPSPSRLNLFSNSVTQRHVKHPKTTVLYKGLTEMLLFSEFATSESEYSQCCRSQMGKHVSINMQIAAWAFDNIHNLTTFLLNPLFTTIAPALWS